MARGYECEGQASLDLWRCAPSDRKGAMADGWKAWLANVKRVEDPALFALFDEMVETLGFSEACERSKTFDLATRHGFTVEELVGIIGVLSESDYHTCWDRSWAYRQGVPKEEIAAIGEREY